MRVCIVGGGLTGAITASILKSRLPQSTVELWDKASRFGGRMCTKRKPSEPRNCSVDVGAQYVSSTPEYFAAHKSHYSELLSAGVLQPMTCTITDDRHPPDTRHFVAPGGMAEVVQHYVHKSQCVPRLSAEVRTVGRANKGWRVATAGEEGKEFDAVLLTLPVPQLLKLQGDVSTAIDDVANLRSELEGVRYSSRYCLGMFYPPSAADKVTLPGDVGAAYINKPDSPFCYVAVDNIRRGLAADNTAGVSVMAHTSRHFGDARVEETKEALLPELLKSFSQLMPNWPQPVDSLCHKWRYSQVVTAVPSSRGGSVGVTGGSLVLSGDAFTHSNVDGCISAATSAAQALVDYANTLS